MNQYHKHTKYIQPCIEIYTSSCTQNRNTNKHTPRLPYPHPPQRRKHNQLTHIHNTQIVTPIQSHKKKSGYTIPTTHYHK